MANSQNLNVQLGSQFVLRITDPIGQNLSLQVGVKSSSLFSTNTPVPYTHITVNSAQALGMYRAVTVGGNYCTKTATSLPEYAGVTSAAVVQGVPTRLVIRGLITDAGWTWTANSPVFVGVNGILTQTAGALPIRRIGWAISATQINLEPYPIIGA